jgi:putative DNA primase/helicase
VSKPTSKPPARGTKPAAPAPIHVDTPNWHNLFVRTKRGEVASCASNVVLALSNDTEWKGVLGFNTFIGDIEAVRPPPWKGDLAPGEDPAKRIGPTYWTDQDTTRCGIWLARKHGVICPDHIVGAGLQIVAEHHKFHPIRDYLQSLEWDGEERVNSWLIRYAGASDNHYTRAATAKWMIGLVARVFEPGCMFRMMLILEGLQNTRKSTALRAIAVRDAWFMETTIAMGSIDSYQTLRGKWIVEFAELDSLSRSETSRVKQYVSERTSTYRPSYGRRAVDFHRQCGFAGSTNDSEYLKDDTGATRFHPVRVTKTIDVEGILEERDQLWAEAVVRYKRGELPYIDNKAVQHMAAKVTEARRQADAWEEPVARWLARLNSKRAEQGVTTYEVLTQALGKNAGDLGTYDSIRAGKVLRLCKWDLDGRPRAGADGTRPRVYRPMRHLVAVPDQGSETCETVGPTDPGLDRKVSKPSAKRGLVQVVHTVQSSIDLIEPKKGG